MVFAFLKERTPNGHAGASAAESAGHVVYELDPHDPYTTAGVLRLRARQRAEGGWTLLGSATAPDGRRYQIWQRVERGEAPTDPDRPAA